MTVDNTDKKIVSILQENGRASLSEIGEKAGFSHVAAGKRLDNLCEKTVKVSAGLNAEQLGLRLAIVNAEVESPERLRELMRVFSKCPRTIFVTTTTGAYNVMTMMVAEDTDTLNAIIECCSLRAQKGIRRSEATIGEAPLIPKHLPIKIVANKDLEIAPCGIHCGKCERYHNQKCLACPATRYYRGPL
jgi:DNA-binding Lrp family transcriptional regulator